MIKIILLLFGLAFANSKIKDFTNFDIFETIQSMSPELTSLIITALILLLIYSMIKNRNKK